MVMLLIMDEEEEQSQISTCLHKIALHISGPQDNPITDACSDLSSNSMLFAPPFQFCGILTSVLNPHNAGATCCSGSHMLETACRLWQFCRQ